MPDQNQDADAKLKKLGQRVRYGLLKEYPSPEKSVETIREALREQWEQEQKAKREKPTVPSTLGRTMTKERQPEEPEPGR